MNSVSSPTIFEAEVGTRLEEATLASGPNWSTCLALFAPEEEKRPQWLRADAARRGACSIACRRSTSKQAGAVSAGPAVESIERPCGLFTSQCFSQSFKVLI